MVSLFARVSRAKGRLDFSSSIWDNQKCTTLSCVAAAFRGGRLWRKSSGTEPACGREGAAGWGPEGGGRGRMEKGGGLITLGVGGLKRSSEFYERLGWGGSKRKGGGGGV